MRPTRPRPPSRRSSRNNLNPPDPTHSPSDLEQRLLEESARELFEHAPCGYLSVLPNGIIANVNETFLSLTGYTRAEVLGGRKFRDLLTIPGRIFYETHFIPLLKMQGRVNEIAFDLICPGNPALPILLNAAERQSKAGPAKLTWMTIFDATDRRRYERELLAARGRAEEAAQTERAAKEFAEKANRSKDEFLALISHELRSPLNAIMGWTQLLRQSHGKVPDLDEGLLVIERNTRAQVQLVEDLMDMGRITSGKIRLEVQTLNLATVIEDALATARPAAAAKSITLQKVLDPSVLISGDAGRLQQVFWNLLSNAMKFTPKDGSVRIVMQRVNSHIEVSVTDSGQGMKPEFLPYVFEKFRQLDGADVRKTGGLGLGLSIVKNLVEMHGGAISAHSRGEGKGSTFLVTLPLGVMHDETSVHPRAAVSSAEVNVDRISLARTKILVVDDEQDARDMLMRLLTRFHAEVQTAASADEAVAVIQQFKPHLLISDIGLPGQDGYELIRRVRMLGDGVGNTSAIALTAFGRMEDRTRAMLAGYQMHLAKPIAPSELIATAASLTGVLEKA